MTPEAEAKFIGNLVRVVDREGGVWWTLPEHVESKRNLERTHVNDEPSAGEVEYQRLYWRPKP